MKISVFIINVHIAFLLISCQSKNVVSFNNVSYPILDSLDYVAFPDNNYMTDGNYYFNKIISLGDNIIPHLIEKISDTTTTKYKYADFYNLTHGDIAIELLQYLYKQQIPLRNILFEEFHKELKNKNMEVDFYDSVYYYILFSNSPKKNHENRVRFYKRIKKWHDKNK